MCLVFCEVVTAFRSEILNFDAQISHIYRYIIPGGSAGHFHRKGYTFDVGSSMMFGFGEKGTTNLITKCLETVGKKLETIPDPTQIHYHLPKSKAHPEVCPCDILKCILKPEENALCNKVRHFS